MQPLLKQLQQWCAGTVSQVLLTVNKPEAAIDTGALSLPIKLIHNVQPRGFGANHNAAFKHCHTPWFLVLNPDIRMERDSIADLLHVAGPRTGLLAPRIQEPGKSALEPYRELPTPAELLRRRLPGHRPPTQPAWIAGMFMLLRAEAFAAVKGFDERFFMYCEDVDLCARLRLAGWSLQLEESVTARHDAQRASQASLQPLLWHLASLGRLWTSPAFSAYRRLLREERFPDAMR
ncbi:candidate b-glycosyltransferase, Glycosyltransferase Family 2 [Ramlibacter tataouinensis TTB310]|uniref:Candidate b-glycosyltransferase, Glycosyltransferase Family 2 n=1 Tax=Ramlibacter tataouinensis (strain ATCC BAA-407 / DSM 14655 / LMG 21543 / TTB310) TaxID=365046 RepID=F5XYX6_RAMTT|nr:candidate b-glycosyltransferase, Glycosyltransferase Family 2 [Ramlibacter tataouinensis TTB310]